MAGMTFLKNISRSLLLAQTGFYTVSNIALRRQLFGTIWYVLLSGTRPPTIHKLDLDHIIFCGNQVHYIGNDLSTSCYKHIKL